MSEASLPTGFIRAVTAVSNQDALLRTTAEWLPTVIEAERTSVALPVDDTHLEVHAFGGTTSIEDRRRIPVATSLIGRAYREQRLVVTDDLAATGLDLSRLVDAGLRSAMAAPMMSTHRCLGTINVGNNRVGFYNDVHREVLQSVADLIGSSLRLLQAVEAERTRARTDDLTGILNRRAIIEDLERRFATGRRLAVLYLDLDDFKSVNDTHGHDVGDQVLCVLTRRISRRLEPGIAFGRLGGDEFLIVVDEGVTTETEPDDDAEQDDAERDDASGRRPAATDDGVDNSVGVGRAEEVAETLVQVCADPIVIGTRSIHPLMSIGIARPEVVTAAELMAEADRAMYRAKRSGRRIAVAAG